jgi:hypothetical protein
MRFLNIILLILGMAGSSFAQALPENAYASPYGQGWDCVKGYYKSGQKCLKVQPPENAGLNYLGNGWDCNRGYYISGQNCLKVEIPENAGLNYLGNGWQCNRGYYKSGQSCLKIQLPENAIIDYLGNGWECNRGYYKSSQNCLKVQIPTNASLNYLGNGWDCNKGFKKSGNSCVVMSAQESQKQKEIDQVVNAKMKRRKAMAISGGDCKSEYKTNAEVCVEIGKVNIECNQSYADNYYRDCDVTLSYDVRTNYEGNAYLDVRVECKVEIEYKGRQTYSTQSDSSRKDESHSLYAHGSDSERLRFNFSFSSYREITNVRISSAKCEIDSADLF